MSRELVNRICAEFPGAVKTDPWGGEHDAWKIGGKMFATIGMKDTGVSVKCADVETAQLLIDMGVGIKAPYFHRSWLHIPWGSVDDAEMAERLRQSYQIIRAKLPKKVQAALEG